MHESMLHFSLQVAKKIYSPIGTCICSGICKKVVHMRIVIYVYDIIATLNNKTRMANASYLG